MFLETIELSIITNNKFNKKYEFTSTRYFPFNFLKTYDNAINPAIEPDPNSGLSSHPS